jgi:hypothetical protein
MDGPIDGLYVNNTPPPPESHAARLVGFISASEVANLVDPSTGQTP